MKTKQILMIALFTTFFTAHAFAQTAPKVSCWLTYNQVDADGTTQESAQSPVFQITRDGGQTELKGFLTQGTLRRICAADGGPCSHAYDLTVTVIHGESKSAFYAVVTADERTRYSTSLTVGNESGFVNCNAGGAID